MLHRFAIADTCFLIDWAKYRRRDLLFKLFNVVYVTESVIREIKSEDTISWISGMLAAGKLALYTETNDEINEARELMDKTRAVPIMIHVDLPEALCLVIGKRRGYTVLTENRGAIMSTEFIDKYKDVVVWRALEILLAGQLSGYLNIDCADPEGIFLEYEEDTLHIFPRKDYENAIKEVRKRCRKKN
ncbi:MAG: hypothetical protein ACP5GU_08175 [Thermoprotei archaeon]|jgi:hypothetical protein